jgi:hypothetical protein
MIRQILPAALIVLCIAQSAAIFGCAPPTDHEGEADRDIYWLILGSRESVLSNKDSVPHFEPGGSGEEIVLYLNGHPLLCKWNRGYVTGVNQYLLARENVLAVSGTLSTTGYLKLAHYRNGKHVKDFVAKEIAKGERKASVDVVKFDADIKYDVSTDTIERSRTEAGRQEIRRELTQEIKSLYRLIDEGNVDKVKEVFYEGYLIWGKDAYLRSPKDMNEAIERYKKDGGWLSSTYKILEPKWSEVRFLYGEKSIYVFAGWAEGTQTGTLLRLEDQTEEDKGEIVEFAPLRFVRKNGKWITW